MRFRDRHSAASSSEKIVATDRKGIASDVNRLVRRAALSVDSLEPRRLLAAFTIDPNISVSSNNFHTFADAIAAAGLTAEADDTIDVVAGAYTENVVINTPLSLRGAKFGVDPRPGRGTGESIVTGQIAISSPGVVVDGFTVLNGDAGVSAPTVSAIYLNADASVTNNIVHGVGAGVAALIGAGVTGSVSLEKNMLSGFAVGVRIDGQSLAAAISQNLISGNSAAGVEIDLATLTGTAAVALNSNALSNPNVPQISLLGGDVTDSVTLLNNAVTLEGTSAFISASPTLSASGLSTTTFTILRTTSEDTAIDIDLNLDGTSLNAPDTTGLAGGVSVAGNVVTYTPTPNFNGNTSFTFTTAGGASGSVNIAVVAANDAPVASDSSISTDEDVDVGGTLSGVDIDSNPLTFSMVSQPANGVVVITDAATGAYTFTPNANWNGTTSFTFQVSDGSATSNTATVTVTVNAANDAPVANNSAIGTDEDVAVSGTLSGSDIDSGSLTYSIVSQPAHGVVSITDASTGAYTFTPTANWNGSTSFTFNLSDGSETSNTATVTIAVNAVNDAPIASNSSISTDEDVADGGTLSGNDIDSSSLTYSVVSQPAHGVVTITDASTGAYTFAPAANWNGLTSFTFHLSDGSETSNTATVTVTVNAVNDTPVAIAIPPVSVDEGTSTTVALNDYFGDVDEGDAVADVLTYSLSGAPAFASINPTTGVVTFSPGALDSGVYSFTAIATDTSNASVSAGISLTVNNVVNNSPVFSNLPTAVTINENAIVPVFNVDASDADAGQSLVYSIVGGNGSGLFAIDANTGVVSLTGPLDAEAVAQHTLAIRVTDNGSPAPEFMEANLVVNVADVDDNPTLVTLAGPSAIGEGSLATFVATATDADVNDLLTYKWFVDDVEQAGQTDSTFAITFGDQGSHAIRVEVSDRGLLSGADSKTVTVSDVAPTVAISPSVLSVNEGSSFNLNIGGITDPGVGDVASIGQVAVWWQDGSYTLINESTNADLLAIIRAGGTVSVPHIFSDGQNASRPMTVSVYDSTHSYAFNTAILVNNVAPTGTFAAITPSVQAGSSAFVNWFGQTDVSAEDRVAGLRYTYILDVNVPGGDGIYNAGDILIAGDGTYDNSSSLSQIQIPGSLLATAGEYKVIGLLIDKDGSPILTRQVSITVNPSTFLVTSLGGDHSGFTMIFNRQIDLSVLNVYDGTDVANDTADIILTRSSGQQIRGSLVINAARNGFDFLVTGGILSQGTYTVRLNSGVNAFKDLFGAALDGDSNGVAGGNYIATFGVNAPPGPVLSTPDFSRGPGQPVDIIPGNLNSDLPITMNSPIAVSSINFQLRYDQTLLDVTNVVAGAGLPAGWSVDFSIVSGGVNISLIKSSGTAIDIPAGSRELVRVIASVPNTAAIYGKAHVLSFATIVVNGNASIEGTADRSVHKVAFVGDANRDGTLNVGDAALIQTVVLGTVTGFDAYPLIDPVIIVDSSRNGAVDSQDASNAALSGFTGARPSDVPAFTPVSVPTTIGVDPTFSLPNRLVGMPGSTVTVPLNVIDDARGIQAGHIRINYDTALLDLNELGILAGTLLSSGWQVVTNLNDAEGWVEIGFYSGNAIAGGSAVTGTLVNLQFAIAANATEGITPLTIATPLNTPVSPTSFYNRQGVLLATTALSGSLLIDTQPPTVAQTTFNFSGSSHTFTVVFSEDVGASIAAGDFELVNLTTNTAVSVVVSSVSSDGKTVTLSFTGTGGIASSILKDGDYRLRVRAGQVTDLAGRVNAADVDSNFFFMNADLNHDRAVNFDDLLILAQHYGETSGTTFAAGDLNYDGQVSFDDLLVLAQRYGSTLLTAPRTPAAGVKRNRWSETVIA